MNPLLSILRAAHCRSTHHFFAIDALPLVQTESGKRLTNLIVRHHDRYLSGAKDPDTRFRDFQNHVIHVTDGYWGGAPRVAHAWYDRMQRYLRTDRFSDAAHAAGVLSHYFTDPLMPLHTQQCDREKVLHRPIEWSITKSYSSIFQAWKNDEMRIVFQLSDGPGWLGEAILHGARYANRSYFPLLDTYDLKRGCVEPQAGLSLVARKALAELFGLAITGWARVIERAAIDAESALGKPLPMASTSMAMVLATIRVPTRLWLRRIENRQQQRAIEALVSEFQRTGTLKETLPSEVDVVHRVVQIYNDEIRWKQERQRRLASKATVVNVERTDRDAQETVQGRANPAPEPGSHSAPDHRPTTIPFAQSGRISGLLSVDNPLVDAPSIGPKTAARFSAIGIDTVGQLLAASAEVLAENLSTYWIKAATIGQWQAQAKLMCEIAGLRACDAQLIAGAGHQSAATVAESEPQVLHQQVSQFATTTAGRRYLRGAAPPKLADVKRWISDAAASPSLTAKRAA